MNTLVDRPVRATSSSRYAVAGAILAVIVGMCTALVQPLVIVLLAGLVVTVAVIAITAYRPVLATYGYLATVLFLAGLNRGDQVPLVRANEAVLALLTVGALVGGYLRFVRGERLSLRPTPFDLPLAVFVLLSTVWPLCWKMLRGDAPTADDLSAVLPIVKLTGLYLLVRITVTEEPQRIRCIRIIVWTGAVISVIAVMQILHVAAVESLLDRGWDSSGGGGGERGSTTLSSPIATGDVVVICLLLVIWCGLRGLLGQRERRVLGVLLACGVLAAGQFSTWIAAAFAVGFCVWRYPTMRGPALRLWPVGLVAVVLGGPALVRRLAGFGGEFGVPRSWLGRWDNLSTFFLPRLDDFGWVLGVAPDPVLPAPETYREVIYLESGYLSLLWVGGVPLLAAFVWLSAGVLKELRRESGRPGAVGASASALEVVWWAVLVLSVIDPHLTLRGAGDLIFVLLGLIAARGPAPRRLPTTPSAPRSSTPIPVDRAVGRAADICIAGIALLVLAVPMLLIAVVIRMSSPGPALFTQDRVGRHRRLFTLYKFRTMHVGGDEAALRDLIDRELRGEDTSTDGSYKLDCDTRITTIGRILRRTSLDELPQLWNIVRGDMAIVGPRPCLEWEAEMFPARYSRRFAVRPGLTGLWQVNGRSTLGTLDMLELDTRYAQSQRLRTDLAIMARTVPVLLRGDGAR